MVCLRIYVCQSLVDDELRGLLVQDGDEADVKFKFGNEGQPDVRLESNRAFQQLFEDMKRETVRRIKGMLCSLDFRLFSVRGCLGISRTVGAEVVLIWKDAHSSPRPTLNKSLSRELLY